MAQQNPQRPAGKLERPGIRRRLIHELAREEKTQAQLAREYGCDRSSITLFKQRHEQRILEVAADIENEFAGLWVAQKVSRLDEMQNIYDGIDSGELEDLDSVKTRIDILRKVAEELGQIPNRSTVRVEGGVKIELVGVDPDALS